MNFKTVKNKYFIKLSQRVSMILKDFFNLWKHYGFSLAWYNAIWWLSWYLHASKVCMWAFRKKKHLIMSFLNENFSESILKYNNTVLPDEIISSNDYRIWVFWAQGISNAPELVKACNKNLNNLNSGRVVNIDLQNLNEYIEIPDEIFKKIDRGIISLTHLSDIVRFKLLSKYGGVWLDSTCWVNKELPSWLYEQDFFSVKSEGLKPLPLCSDSRWCTWSLGTNRLNYLLFAFVSEVLIEYALNCDYWIEYLLIDYIMLLAYEKYDYVKETLDVLPENNTKRNNLHFMLNEEFDKNKYQELIKDDWLFKLSYKSTNFMFTSDSKPTFYGYLIQNQI